MRTLIDIGSYKGEEIIWGMKNGYEVHAFEPNINMKPVLWPLDKFATINYAAAWDKDGTATLHLMAMPEPGEDGVSLVKEKTNVSQEERTVEVPTINIGRYLKELDKDIDILKINAEGAEYIILESILDNFDYKRIKHWLVEDHSDYLQDEKWSEHRLKVLARLFRLGVELKNYIFIQSLIQSHE